MRKSRKEQLALSGVAHLTMRGHNGEGILADDGDKKFLMEALLDARDKPDNCGPVKIHSYCQMTNHYHAVVGAGENAVTTKQRNAGVEALGNVMRLAHSRYGMRYNKKKNRYGKVAAERPKTRQIEFDADQLQTMFYGDANPMRARMVSHPSRYRWSSYQFYAFGKKDDITKRLDIPAVYLALGKTPKARQRAYRSLMDTYLRRAGLIKDQGTGRNDDLIDLSQFSSTIACIEYLIKLNAVRAGPAQKP